MWFNNIFKNLKALKLFKSEKYLIMDTDLNDDLAVCLMNIGITYHAMG